MKEQGARSKEQGVTAAALMAAVLLLSDQMVKYFFSDSASAYCNPIGPWGIPADNGILIVATGGILVVVAIVFSRCHSRARPQRYAQRFGQESGNLDGLVLKDRIPGQARNDREGGCFEYIPFTASVLLFAGGASNLLDRILFGCVRDFSLIPWFPAFNGADVLLTIGVIVFLSAFFLQRKNPRE